MIEERGYGVHRKPEALAFIYQRHLPDAERIARVNPQGPPDIFDRNHIPQFWPSVAIRASASPLVLTRIMGGILPR